MHKPLVKQLLLPLCIISSAPNAHATECLSSDATYLAEQGVLQLPDVWVESVGHYQASLNLVNTQNPFHFKLSTLQTTNTLSQKTSYQATAQTLHIDSLCIPSPDNTSASRYAIEMQAIPGSEPMQFLLKNAHDIAGNPIFNWLLATNQGALLLSDRQRFDALASNSNTSGMLGARELKFVLTDIDSAHPVLYFMNSTETPLHYDFLRNTLKQYQNLDYNAGSTQFIADSYFREQRRNLVGSVIAYDPYQESENSATQGIYTLEFWPTDPVPAQLIAKAYRTISAAMPFLPSPLAYHPVGTTHEQEYTAFAQDFAQQNIRSISTDSLLANVSSAILNPGVAYGRLKLINPGDPSPGEDSIAIYTYIPNSLGHVGGIITEQPQTPLSHINLKARQNNTPNAYIKNAREQPEFAALIDQWVHYQVSEQGGIQLQLSTETEAQAWLAAQIPTQTTQPEGDLSSTQPLALSQIGHADWIRVGVKAANVAELGNILPEGSVPQGYALPFAMYDEFMRLPRCLDNLSQLCSTGNSISLYEHIEQLLNNPEFQQQSSIREQKLTELRELIRGAEASQELIDAIESVRLFWEPQGAPFTQKLRVRSSTNNEDLPGFNGAGLYDSYTHKPKEGELINSIKEVWASLWNSRAFEERRLHKIDHLLTYMGVLIHPNYGDEQANGVAISKNIYNPNWQGFYINAQYGENSITNPEPINLDGQLINAIPDEFIITRLPASTNGYAWETQFLRHSNITEVYDAPVPTETVLTPEEMALLRDYLLTLHAHFKGLYQGDDTFAMDIEFKITETSDDSRGHLEIKQARPWVE